MIDYLQDYLHHHIPISAALGIQVTHATSEKVILQAPMAPNINHKKTVFGGSLHAVVTLACWSLLFTNLTEWPEPTEIVIQQSEIDYLLPVTKDFTAEANFPELTAWQKFTAILARRGKAKIQLTASIYQDSQLAVAFKGSFVALRRD